MDDPSCGDEMVIRPPRRRYQANLQVGGVAADETADVAVPGNVQNRENQSYICLPLAT